MTTGHARDGLSVYTSAAEIRDGIRAFSDGGRSTSRN
jgi:hypothetical protein